MRKLFTYLMAAGLFSLCVLSYDIIPQNISDKLLGVVKRNVKKERSEILEDMKRVTQKGLIHFEIYDEEGQLMTTFKNPEDFKKDILEQIEDINFRVKSISNVSALAPLHVNIIN